jgi:hypothetical protein
MIIAVVLGGVILYAKVALGVRPAPVKVVATGRLNHDVCHLFYATSV